MLFAHWLANECPELRPASFRKAGAMQGEGSQTHKNQSLGKSPKSLTYKAFTRER